MIGCFKSCDHFEPITMLHFQLTVVYWTGSWTKFLLIISNLLWLLYYIIELSDLIDRYMTFGPP